MNTTINVRVVQRQGRLRLQAADGKFVQCPREWRETLPVGRALPLLACLRSDGKCWVATPSAQS